MKRGDIVAYLFLAITWGMSFLVILKIVHAFGWIGAVSLRALVTAATLFIGALITRRGLHFSAGWWPLLVVGATTVAGQLVSISFAIPQIGTAMAAILVAAIPLFSMILSQLWGLERITPSSLLGLLLGLGGIILLVGFPAVAVTPSFMLGCASSLFGAFCAAFGSNYASRHLRGVGSWEVTLGSFLFGGVLTLPLLLVVPVPTPPQLSDYLYLLLAGVVMSGMTYVVYFRLIASIGATKAISVEFAVTVVAVLVGTVILHEPLSAVQAAGASAIVAGCMLVLGMLSPRPRRSAAAP